ncbi:uncharacterized protein METZ01_LOCUS21297 [marine metagenome]|uniref:Uncharacterized protein n=1 Tax=marine metagenome TaxID=408172 RepID=A0A381PSJ5_9ZZZZ
MLVVGCSQWVSRERHDGSKVSADC